MNVNVIIEKLSVFDKKYPLEAMEAATLNQEEVTPYLLDALDMAYTEKGELDGDYMLHMFGMYLLSQFKEKHAFEKLVKLLELSYEELNLIMGDTLTEDYQTLLVATYDGNRKLLENIIENENIDFYARGAALKAYGLLIKIGELTRDEYEVYLKQLLNDNVQKEFIAYVANEISDYMFLNLIPELKQINKMYQIDFVWSNYGETITNMFRPMRHQKEEKISIDSAAEEMCVWACFEQDKNDKPKRNFNFDDIQEEMFPSLKKPVKVGRNEPCPCGSGNKFKKCCDGKKEPTPEEKYLEALLEFYPKRNEIYAENQVTFYDYFSEEAIEIDRHIAAGMRGVIPIYPLASEKKYEVVFQEFKSAYDILLQKLADEKIDSLDAFDDIYQIQYPCAEWLTRFVDLIDDMDAQDRFEGILPCELMEKYKNM